MKIRKFTMLFLAVMLAACSTAESGSSVSDEASGRDDVSEIEVNYTAGEVKQAYKGAEQLEGAIFDKFIMPEMIEVPQINKLYELTINTVPDDIEKERLQRLFSEFVGEGYDPREFMIIGNDLGYRYAHSDEQSVHCSYMNGVFQLVKTDKTGSESRSNEWSGYVGLNRDQLLELGDIQTSVGQQAAMLDKKLGELFQDIFEPFEIQIQYMDVFTDGSTLGQFALTFEGVPVQWQSSGMEQAIAANEGKPTNGDVKQYFARYAISAGITGDANWEMVITDMIPHLIEKKELGSVISLQRAVGILQSELSEGSVYSFSDVRLMYTGLITDSRDMDHPDASQEALFNSEPKTLRPVWCFFIDSSGQPTDCIKVDAVTGEVFMDM